MLLQSDNASDVKLKLESTTEGRKREFEGLLLEGMGSPSIGVVMLHGRNGSPDGAVVSNLRRSLNEIGYTTLSLQNPLPQGGDEFADYMNDVRQENYVFREASARIRAAISEVKNRGATAIVLLGFSMGARMHSAFLSLGEPTALPIVGFIALSIGTNGIQQLDSTTTLNQVRVPVLDVYGEGDADVAKSASARKSAYEAGQGKAYTQVMISGSVPHNFAGAEEQLDSKVRGWIMALVPVTK
jgi:dienelactone hydrolase